RCLSDWSSDVCSSDLVQERVEPHGSSAARFEWPAVLAQDCAEPDVGQLQRLVAAPEPSCIVVPQFGRGEELVEVQPLAMVHDVEIGRASCRERGWNGG